VSSPETFRSAFLLHAASAFGPSLLCSFAPGPLARDFIDVLMRRLFARGFSLSAPKELLIPYLGAWRRSISRGSACCAIQPAQDGNYNKINPLEIIYALMRAAFGGWQPGGERYSNSSVNILVARRLNRSVGN
jgi:hypothetical protein